MATVKHHHQTALPDDPTKDVSASEWNEDHDVTLVDADIPATIARDAEVTSAVSALSSVYQPLDSDLTAIAALTTTAFGRGLLTLADAAALAANHVHVQPDGLHPATLHATYGDDFDGASLNARWTRHVQGSGEETYQDGRRASALRVAYSTGAVARYIYQTAPNGTNETWETSVTPYQETATNQMYALLMVDTAGTGVAALLYDNTPGVYLANVTSHAYASSLTAINALTGLGEYRYGQRIWLRLRKAAGVYSASASLDGETYWREATGTPSAFTPTRVGIGRILGTNANDIASWHWFDKTA